MTREAHRIHIILDGKDYGMRFWKNVPRVGEAIILKGYRSDNRVPCLIKQVAWGVAEDDYNQAWPDINMVVERIT